MKNTNKEVGFKVSTVKKRHIVELVHWYLNNKFLAVACVLEEDFFIRNGWDAVLIGKWLNDIDRINNGETGVIKRLVHERTMVTFKGRIPVSSKVDKKKPMVDWNPEKWILETLTKLKK